MTLQQQIGAFRRLVEESGRSLDDFELTAAGDGFRGLMAGGSAELEVCYRAHHRRGSVARRH